MNDDEDDFPTDVCFTCGVSPTRAEAHGRAEGYQQAITDLRDCDAFAAWKASQPKPSRYASPAYVHHREAAETADYLEHLAKERTP